MSKSNKLRARLLSKPSDFTFKELETLLLGLGFSLSNAGGTSGSAVRFINKDNGHVIRLHKPHPKPELKSYLINNVINELRKGGYLSEK